MLFPLLVLLAAPAAHAGVSDAFVDKVISETDPTAFAPAPWTTDQFVIEAPAEVKARLVPDSLQWVRVDELLVVPRALAELTAPPQAALEVKVAERHYAIPAGGTARVSVPLLGSAQIPVRVGAAEPRLLRVSFRGQPAVLLDTSCSRAPLRIEDTLAPGTWAYVGCRTVRVEAGGQGRPELELVAYLDDDQTLRANGATLPAATPVAWRLTHENPALTLEGHAGSLTFRGALPEVAHRARVGMGIGPYNFDYDQGGTHTLLTVPLTTLYGSYQLASSNRIVLFGAFSLNRRIYADAGAYFQFESFRALDRRVSFQLLIGGHGYSYSAPEANLTRFNFPQGFEIFFRDFLRRGHDASLGGFLQPPINGKEYYNTWLRWSPGSWFLEVNYIYAAERPEFVIRTYGLSAGFPLASFL